MRLLYCFLACFLAWPALSQTTTSVYPYPKPRPTNGETPNSLIHYSQSIGPGNYGNENPVLWAIDLGGGIHSRLNAADRLSIDRSHTQEGAIVYDASDKVFYGIETNLAATIPLFRLDKS